MTNAVARLPALREDLQLLQSRPDQEATQWQLFDPLSNRYYQVIQETVAILKIWQAGQTLPAFLRQAVSKGVAVDEARLQQLLDFLRANQLLQATDQQSREKLESRFSEPAQSWLSWLIHHYLFIRLPLWKPHYFLERSLPLALKLANPKILWSVRFLGLVGIILLIRQWSQFTATFDYFFNWQGLLIYGLTLILIKSAHELGHAYTSHYYGCRVNTMGVAFLVMLPVLYTDTSNAWRLHQRRKRLNIALAGIRVELHIALLATFLWNFMPEGPWRTALFFIVTTSWVTTLMINLSPFMRFDGYFVLSDWLGVANLQSRAFHLGRWQLRKWLLGYQPPKPEKLSSTMHRRLVIYAWSTWIYRFFLFLGIALLVYHFAFKALGLFLFAVEIIWFIGLPIKKEMQFWIKNRKKIGWTPQVVLLGLSILVALIVMLIPFQQTLSLPAVMQLENVSRIYVSENARVAQLAVKNFDTVSKGQLLLALSSDELERDRVLVSEELLLIRSQLDQVVAGDRQRQLQQVRRQQLEELLARQATLASRLDKLQVRAPSDGVVEFSRPLMAGQWLSADEALLLIKPVGTVQIIAYVDEKHLHQIALEHTASWFSESLGKVMLKAESLQFHAEDALKYPELASVFGGMIPAEVNQQDQLKTRTAYYPLTLTALEPVHLQQRQSGVVWFEAEAESFMAGVIRQIAALLIRESGF